MRLNKRRIISELVELSKYSSKHPEFVQGAGGNCSVKDKNIIAIKASGFFLEEVNKNTGYVLINFKNKKQIDKTHLKPSLEMSLHFLLGKYVIHTHPILVGGIVCDKHGEEKLKIVFKNKNHFWIPYFNPGTSLCIGVERFFKKHKINKKNDIVLFLQNHGIFISSKSKKKCILMHEEIINKLSTYFKYEKIKKCYFKLKKNFLTPDHVVYFHMNNKSLNKRQRDVLSELNHFNDMTLSLIHSKKSQVNFLKVKDVNFIKNMEEEKYRQSLLKKKI